MGCYRMIGFHEGTWWADCCVCVCVCVGERIFPIGIVAAHTGIYLEEEPDVQCICLACPLNA